MIETLPCVANIVSADLLDVAGDPITGGTVNFYLVAMTGTNAGKWYTLGESPAAWSATPVPAAIGAHLAEGHWTATIAAGAWVEGIRYLKYAREEDGDDVSVSEEALCKSPTALASAITALAALVVAARVTFPFYLHVEPAGNIHFNLRFGGHYNGQPYWTGMDGEEEWPVYLWADMIGGMIENPDNGVWVMSHVLGDSDAGGYLVCPAGVNSLAGAFLGLYQQDGIATELFADGATVSVLKTIEWYPAMALLDPALAATQATSLAVKAILESGTFGSAALLAAIVAAGAAAAGDGEILVNHDTGGVDNLQAEHGGAGLAGVTVRAYLQDEYEHHIYDVKGRAVTGTDGRWLSPMYLDAGTYIFAFARADKITGVKECEVVGE